MRYALSALLLVVGASRSAEAQFTCPTSDDVQIQSALDTAAANGGGTVDLAARLYYTCQTLILGNNVHLRGAGRGATVIVGSTAVTGKFVNGALVIATIGGAGVRNVSVSRLTVNHWTHKRNGNGIAFVPTGTGYDGEVPVDISIEDVSVIGAGVSSYHNYMIWNFKGQHVKIRNNWVSGGFFIPISAPAPQEGIESFGGYDVLIDGNSVVGVGGACINLGSAGIARSDTVGLFITKNYLYGCNVGINLGTSFENGGQNNTHSLISHNVITYARAAGIDIVVARGTAERDLQITGNSIRVIGPSDLAGGIRLRGRAEGISVLGTLVESNHVEDVSGANAQGIRVVNYPSARVVGNFVSRTAAEGIYAMQSNDLEISRNRVERSGRWGLYVGASAGLIASDNTLTDWPESMPAVLLRRVVNGAVRDNIFKRLDNAAIPAMVLDGGCGVTLTGNLALYPGSVINVTAAACPAP